MTQSDIATLVRAEIELPQLKRARELIAVNLPARGYKLPEQEAWSFAGAILEAYIMLKFKGNILRVYDDIARRGMAISMETLENLPQA